jgi:carbamoyltransferase
MIITSKKEAIDKILQQEIVALFQESSEYGPRALGNRSLLFDPRNKNGKDIVNKIKKREWFRPFAGTVLLEHAHDWFDMGTIKESPYMSYAIPVKEEKKSVIPSITHVDGTCRIQTVTQKQNKKFYELIKEFYKKTKVPILLNTSFNLAGETLVETLDDAHSTIERSDLKYIYLPDC